MIIETMTHKEVFKELNADNLWLDQRAIGIGKKYQKAMKNKHVGHNTVLGISTYITPNQNKVIACHVKNYHTNKYADILFSYMFEFGLNNGQKHYLFPEFYSDGSVSNITRFTSHCIARLQERSNITPIELLKILSTRNDGAIPFMEYEYQGKVTLMCPLANIGGIIGTEGDWGITAVTFITVEQQGAEQLSCLVSGRQVTREVAEGRQSRFLKDYNQHSRFIRRNMF